MSRLLGRLEWALRPNATVLAFLDGAYQWKLRGNSYCSFRLLRSLMTAIVFAILTQRFLTHKPALTPNGGGGCMILISCFMTRRYACLTGAGVDGFALVGSCHFSKPTVRAF